MEFIYAFLHRAFSGMHNGFGYAKKKNFFFAMSVVMVLFPLLVFKTHWLFYLFTVVNALVVYMKTASFKLESKLTFLSKYFDIHLWENFVTGGFVIYLILAHFNILLIICSVYPALILHKGFINMGSGLKFFATATDDPTGKTYGFKLFPRLKIKRGSNTYRLILGGLSLVGVVLIYLFGLNVSF